MKIIHAIILGLIQGITEFIPVSSSAHLNILPWLFNWDNIPDSFDLALHAGTLLAVIIYFFKDWISLIVGGFDMAVKKKKSVEGRVFWHIILATIPAGLVGLLGEKIIEKLTGDNLNIQMIIISIALIVMGVFMFLADKYCEKKISLKNMSLKQGFMVGFSQAIAGAIPGVSRSGITITTARCYGIKREDAARYSFLLSGPMVVASVLVKIPDFEFSLAFVLGILVSFLSGLLVIKFFMDFIKNRSYACFAVYRVALGIAILVCALLK